MEEGQPDAVSEDYWSQSTIRYDRCATGRQVGIEGVVMSTPHEASLTEKERAILASLAAQAEADDPSLAAALRGGTRRPRRRPKLTFRVGIPGAVSHWAWGLLLAVAGLVVMVVSLSVSVGLGVVGAVLTVLGFYRAASVRPGRSGHGESQEPAAASSDS
jgi:Protein of unknown function (DUF3040)